MTNDVSGVKKKVDQLEALIAAGNGRLNRSAALNLISNWEGYKSYAARRHGKLHGAPASSKSGGSPQGPMLYRGVCHPQINADFVANGGQHCPHCGVAKLRDAMESNVDGTIWDVKMACDACSKTWWTTYEASHIDGLSVTDDQNEAFRTGGYDTCIRCGGVDTQVYNSFILSPGSLTQPATCGSCTNRVGFVYLLQQWSLADADAENA